MPTSFEAGTTLRVTQGNSEYPATAWTAALVLNNGGDTPVSIAGVANGSAFDYVIPASQALTPGVYTWAEYFTAISPTTEKARGESGQVTVLPNLANPTTPSFIQSMVTLMETANRSGAGSRRSSVSFNGQSVSWNSPAEFQSQWTFWKAQLIAEQRRAGRLRGNISDGRIDVQFVGPTQRWPRADW